MTIAISDIRKTLPQTSCSFEPKYNKTDTMDQKAQKCCAEVLSLIRVGDQIREKQPGTARKYYQDAFVIAAILINSEPQISFTNATGRLQCEQAVALNRYNRPEISCFLCDHVLRNSSDLEKTLIADLHFVMGTAYEQMLDYPKAAASYKESFNFETDQDAKRATAFDAFRTMLKAKDFKGIIDFCGRANEIAYSDPTIQAKIYYYLVFASIEMKLPTKNAYFVFEQIAKLDIKDSILVSLLHNLHGFVLKMDNRLTEALEKFNECLSSRFLPSTARALVKRNAEEVKTQLLVASKLLTLKHPQIQVGVGRDHSISVKGIASPIDEANKEN